LERAGAEIVLCRSDEQGRVRLKDLLRRLAARDLTSVLVEGGARIHGSFLRANLWDELALFVAPKLAGEGALSWAGFPSARTLNEALPVRLRGVERIGPDLLVTARPAS
jgi:diaminohydroxyphosphoribosylaminopyrimidine deaminase/5-amino-6-(5-phosphoribosylamino)uracil reductase